MMKVEQQNNTTNVYAFEHDMDKEMERGDSESQQQLPKSLEKVLSWQAVRMLMKSKNGKWQNGANFKIAELNKTIAKKFKCK